MFGKRDKADQAKKKRVRLHETTHENDIRFRGPLTAQHFKILGWLCIAIAQAVVLLTLGGRMNAGLAERTAGWRSALSNIANLSLPFLLIANFAQLLNTEEGYRKQLLAYYLVFYRYIVGGVAAFLQEPAEALPAVNGVMRIAMPYGFFAFNIFVDLFLCTLCMLFLNYQPRRVFKGKLRFVFRLMALLPIGYEVGCMVLKVRAARGLLTIPTWAYPLLTVKPPMTFALFLALVMFVKTRELRFRRHGKTHEEYAKFLQTRRNSWNFSVFLAIMLVLASIADVLVVFGFSMNEAVQSVTTDIETSLSAVGTSMEAVADGEVELTLPRSQPGVGEAALPSPGEEDTEKVLLTSEEREALVQEVVNGAMDEDRIAASVDWGMRVANAVGFGDSAFLFYLAPLVLLFSYTRKPKYRLVDMLVPVAGIALILIVYIEGIHQLLGYLPVNKINLQELKDAVKYYAETLM